MLDESTVEALKQLKIFFEEQIGCVVGCGCWVDSSPPWDDEKTLREFARTGFTTWDPGFAAADVLLAIEQCDTVLTQPDIQEAGRHLELSFASRQDFEAFFARTRRVLQEELRRA